jgi:hypothetical protein
MAKLGIWILTLGSALAAVFPPLVHAQEQDFDATVKELRGSLADEPVVPKKEVMIPQAEFGASLIGGYMNVGDNGAPNGGAMVNGFDLHTGVNLYSTNWVAEGVFRDFGPQTYAQNYAASLMQFDVLLVHQALLQNDFGLRVGGGFSASYLKTMDSRVGYQQNTDQTAGLVAIIGIEKLLNSRVSVGPDVDFHAPLTSQTVQRNLVDASLRLNFHF